MACLKLVATTEFREPPFRGLEIVRPAHLYRSRPDFFFAVDLSFLYFVVQDALHLVVGWPPAALLPLAPILPPPQQVPPRYPILPRNFFNVMSISNLN